MSFLEDFRRSVTDGLSEAQKQIPCRFFYDATGSRLFSQITELDDYYPTRAEKEILRDRGALIAAGLPQGLTVVELGSGTSEKTPQLLSALNSPECYVPVDIDDVTLSEAAQMIGDMFPKMRVVEVHADFTKPFRLPDEVKKPLLGFFPGSTIGNFTREDAVKFLAKLAHSLGDDAYLLLGADLVKERAVLEKAYDDTEGVTAQFNRNLLVRINKELDGDFDLDAFGHRAIWNSDINAVQMFLESKRDQSVTIDSQTFHFEAGEKIHTEDSHKYTPDSLRSLAREAGWRWLDMWTDDEGLFSVHLFRCGVDD